ncbi:MAG: ATP-binding protein [Planctomycetota bacterium]|nr:ATP-binding protein [Planctomycetota bacterium]
MERLRLPAKLPSLTTFREFVNRSAVAAGVEPQLLPRIELVLEELLVNHVLHAYGSGEGDSEVVCFRREPAYFCLEVIDEAPAFDPLGQATPDLTLAARDRPIGGLGIHLVRSLADEVGYRREAGRNVITACFAIKSEATPGS